VLAGVSAELELQRKVRLLESNRVKAAITVGIFNPEVVLPADTEEWPANRCRSVLSHELAHVKRWDTLIEAVAVMVTVVYWFNPLVWFAVRRHRIERERDCDNVVLRTGVKPSDYAELLMNIAADLGGSVKPAWQLSTISQGSNLKERLMCILNPKINRNRGNRRSAIIIGIVVLALILPLSTSGIWSSEVGEVSKKDKEAKAEKMKEETSKAQADEKKKEKADQEKIEKKQKEKAKAQHKKQEQMSAQAKIDKRWQMVMEQESSAAALVGKAVKKEGIKAGIDKYKKLKTAKSEEYYFKEEEFNVLGYKLLFAGKKKEAVGIFQLNVDAYPESWNTHDSLGEACFARGDYECAIKCYEKSLELNPKNDNGKKMLEKIKKKIKHQT
jgi:TolA-binding protein